MSASPYTLDHSGEILAVLDRLQQTRALVAVSFDGDETIASSILDVRRASQDLVFDIAREAAVNDRMFASSTLAFTSELDHIRITFETGTAARMSRADGPAASAGLPLAVTRLQRRESFRATLPVDPQVRCTMVDAAGWATTSQVIDLSCGGAALVVDEALAAAISPGSTHELILSLPDIGPIGIEANLRTVRATGDASDTSAPRVRLGFRFDHLPPKTVARIQRYVQAVEVGQSRALRRRDGD